MCPLRLAFIGGSIESAIGRTHYIATQMDNEFILEAACFSTRAQSNAQSAEIFGNHKQPLRIYTHYKELLENERGNIDAICVLTPTPTHKEIVIESLLHGFNVICEKTLCLNLEEALQISTILQEQRGFLAVIYNYTGYPMLRELRAMLCSKRFGKIYSVHIEMPQEGFVRCDENGRVIKPQDWRLQDSKIPIISLDLGIHCQNIISFLTNSYPLECIAMKASYGHFNIVSDINILARYESDIHVNMWFSKSALGARNGLQVRIYAENFSATWLQSDPEILLLNDKNGNRSILDRASPHCLESNKPRYNRFKAGHPAGFIEAFANYYSDVASSLREYLKSKECTHTKAKSLHLEQAFAQRDFANPYVFGITESIRGLAFFESAQQSLQTKSLQPVLKSLAQPTMQI
ncbi:gfo/Idh/MocA family oxidoreductase [Helicobacter aurati]|uniref:Gfo/Idh/MocA family oxidoreductase n=1 Tax=Helicobacter aurati TaxID=137778 RepID=A0A3D8IZC3_9HELI|nr:Gfo/Idh/MocA family oxidoreductase [Helicobacter aurati]RDU70617.1 gfo/Idh/MocA family oxidoreductase [Helicobacter aurati]